MSTEPNEARVVETFAELATPDVDDGDQAEAPPTPSDTDETSGADGDSDD